MYDQGKTAGEEDKMTLNKKFEEFLAEEDEGRARHRWQVLVEHFSTLDGLTAKVSFRADLAEFKEQLLAYRELQRKLHRYFLQTAATIRRTFVEGGANTVVPFDIGLIRLISAAIYNLRKHVPAELAAQEACGLFAMANLGAIRDGLEADITSHTERARGVALRTYRKFGDLVEDLARCYSMFGRVYEFAQLPVTDALLAAATT